MNTTTQQQPTITQFNQFVRTEKPTTKGWELPAPLTPETESALYPIEALPGIVGGAVREVVEIVKCPAPLAANSALSVLSVAAQGLANVQPLPNLKPSPLSLYTLSIADSGERKTTADNFFSGGLQQWAYQKQQDDEAAVISSKTELMAWQSEVEGIHQAIKQAARKGEDTQELKARLIFLEQGKPAVRRSPDMIFEDSTPESIAYELAHTWPCAGVLSSEAGVIFGGHGMKAENITRNLATLNKLWEGGSITVKRRGAENFTVANARLTMGLAVQPSVISDFYEASGDTARGSGFSARFLLSWPSSTQGSRTLTLEEATRQHKKHQLNLFYAKLHDVLEQQYANVQDGRIENLPALQLSNAALKVWLEYFNSVEESLRAGGDMQNCKDVASKSADNAARLAGLFHLFNGGDVHDTIQTDSMEVAATLAGWHLYEARRFFGELAVPADLSNAVKLDAWLIQYCQLNGTDFINKREAQRLCPNRLRSKQKLNDALAELEEANRVKIETEGRSSIIEINPALLGGHQREVA